MMVWRRQNYHWRVLTGGIQELQSTSRGSCLERQMKIVLLTTSGATSYAVFAMVQRGLLP
jgi:hypothetical protein